eukprot:s1226_g3.t1
MEHQIISRFEIHSVDPPVGSEEGGARVTVKGIGFGDATVTNQLTAAALGTLADVESWSATEVVFVTRKLTLNVAKVDLMVNLISAAHKCGSGPDPNPATTTTTTMGLGLVATAPVLDLGPQSEDADFNGKFHGGLTMKHGDFNWTYSLDVATIQVNMPADFADAVSIDNITVTMGDFVCPHNLTEKAGTLLKVCFGHTVLLLSDGCAVAIGHNGHGQCNIPALEDGMTYTQISAGRSHTVLLRSDGNAVAIGFNGDGRCDIPPLDEGITYTQISAGDMHTVLLRSDGCAVAIGGNGSGQCNIPGLDEGLAYTQVSAGDMHTVLLRNDGCAVAIGDNDYGQGQCNIPPLEEGMVYTQISAGFHTVLLRSDGHAAAIGFNGDGRCDISPLHEGITYTQISAGDMHTVLLRSDGCAVAIGGTGSGQCNIPALDEGLTYAKISAGSAHTVLLRSDGSAVAIGSNVYGQCNIPPPEPGICCVGDLTCGRDVALQLEFVGSGDAVTLICSTLAGEERLRVTTQGIDSAWETHKRIAFELKVTLPNLQLVLPDGELLAKVCRANPGASIAEVMPRPRMTASLLPTRAKARVKAKAVLERSRLASQGI